ncbi:MAG: peptidase [Acidimicrobiales bacterium]|nr:peptidase [Acidimicrobiales bacterium]
MWRVALTAVVLGAGLAAALPAEPAAAATFTAAGSIGQVYTSGHPVGSTVELLGTGGATLASGPADAQGAKLFRDLTPGSAYRVREGGTTSAPLTVTAAADNPPDSFYAGGSALQEGYNYITTRDGTTLAANVTFPKDGSSGPWPVLVDYSGYDPAQPGTTPQEAQLYPYLGYVVVGVNMRGTTCSGGAFWFFEDAQRTDGYDVIESLAHQTWSTGNVGMVGISYSGYSQLYVAATQPPHLRAITPLSPFSDGYRGILYPGGILNDGFALSWALDRQEASKPSAHSWVRSRISGGDTTCAKNQVMRLQSQDIASEIVDGRFNDAKYSYLDPNSFAPDIRVPTYLATQWQDEQTGGYGAELATMIAPHAKLRAEFTNGTHVDSLGPEDFMKVAEFVDLYVGRVVPTKEGNGFYGNGVADGLSSLFGTQITPVPYYFTPFATHAEALAWYEAQDPIRIRWENGGKVGKEGAPYATAISTYPSWPIPAVTPERWYLQPDGALAKTATTVPDGTARGSSSYTYDPTVKRNQSFDGSTDAAWTTHPDVHWLPNTEGKSLSFLTPAFTGKTLYAGNGSADLWVRSSAVDTDFEVTLTDVRPDGKEVEIQSGWLRASRRALDVAGSTVLRPRGTYQAADAAPLPAGQFVPVRIELFPFAHIVRPGERLRVNIEAPGGNQPFWAFSTLPGTATNDIAHSAGMPSSVALPKLVDSRVSFYSPNTAPSCSVAGVTTQAQSLRNQPCRDYLPTRTPTGVTGSVKGDRVALTWQAPPTWPSGPALTGYRITASPGGDTLDVPAASTSASFPTTRSGPLTFQVAAKFGATVAPASDASVAVTLPTPMSVSAKTADGTAAVSWKAPVAAGATVTGYVVTPSVNAVPGTPKAFASTALAQTLTGLTNGSAYTFTVAATYATGTGPASAPSAPATAGVPAAPAFARAVPSNAKATVSWWPSSGNGAPISGYIITPFVGSVAQAPRSFASTSGSQVITGLTNGVTYTFSIVAVNANGAGWPSVTAPVLVNPTVATAPSGVTAKAGNATAVVAWRAPASDGGSPVTGYVVTPSVGGVAQAPQPFNSTALTQTLTGLANGTAYTFTVVAVNGVGSSPTSVASAPITAGTPTQPGFLRATAGAGKVTLSWWPVTANGAPVTGFVVTPYIAGVARPPVIFPGSASSQVVTGLTPGVAYTFDVAAVNANGTSPATRSPAATPT